MWTDTDKSPALVEPQGYTVSTPIASPGTPMRLIELAMERNQLDQMERRFALQGRWEANEAKRAYTVAFADFKRNMPDVVKDMLNKQYNSEYSSLANLVNTTNRELGKWGLNARWDVEQGDLIAVTCILTHTQGHSERVRLQAGQDTSGAKNALQQIKSTLTYLEGATFQAITGVVARASSKDDDGNGSGQSAITADQATELRDLAKEGQADVPKFLAWMGCESFDSMPAGSYQKAKRALQDKIKALKA